MLGSGEITVLPVKSALLPDKFPLNRPCFPLILMQSDLFDRRINKGFFMKLIE